MKTCPNCGQTFDDSINYCLADGAPLSPSFPVGRLTPPSFSVPPRRTATNRSTFAAAAVITVIVFAIVGAAGVGAIYFLRSFSSREISTPPPYNAAPPYNSANNNQSANEPPQFAREVFRFGDEGVGAGQFQSIRAIAVDAEGKIYVGEGERPARVQVFDSSGKFITQWTAPDKDAYLTKLAADRKGSVYAIQGFGLVRLDGATGKKTADIIKPKFGTFNHDDPLEFIAEDVAVALDNSIWVLVGGGTFLHFDSAGKLLGKIKNAPKLASHDGQFKDFAVDGAGNIYAVGQTECYIFKFSAEGKFINRFGGKRGSDRKPGQCFISFNDIAVDGKGRIYVTDSSAVSVFDPDGNVVGSFKAKEAVFNPVFTDKNELWVSAGKGVAKFEVSQ
jgi:hypothetical protein